MKIIIYFLFFVSLVISVNAIDVKIDVKDIFKEGDLIFFDYKINSNKDQEVIFSPHVTCIGGFTTIPGKENVILKTNQAYKGTYKTTKVTEDFDPAQCDAIIDIEPTGSIKQPFKINTLPRFNFEILACKENVILKTNQAYKGTYKIT